MTQFPTALVSLLPAFGAVALTILGLRRMAARAGSAPASPPPRAKEPPPRAIEPPPARSRRPPAPDGTCRTCGTSIPAHSSQCAICERAEAGAANSGWTTLAHWVVFLAVMTAIIGAGWLAAP